MNARAVLFVLLVAGGAAAGTLTVGPHGTYARPCQAIAAATAGDVIEVDAAGSYAGDTCAWSTDNLIVRGVNGRARIDLTGVTPAQQKGIFTIYAANATVENFELSGAAISAAAGNNGAGIRHQGLNLTVRNCVFHDNQDGILGAPSTAGQGAVVIESSEFFHNGAGDGQSHNMYLGNYGSFTLRRSYSHHANQGHLVKSRAYVNVLEANRLTDETGTASYELNLPNGGTSYVIGNVIQQSATTSNSNLLSYAEEGVPAGYDSALFVVNNTFVSDRSVGGTFVIDKAATGALLQNNLFVGAGTITTQTAATKVANFDGTGGADPHFVNRGAWDFHLATGSPCIDTGVLPGSGGARSLVPAEEYVHPLSSTPRVVAGAAIDQGAYEFPVAVDGGTPDGGATDGGTSDGGAADGGLPDGSSGGGPDAGSDAGSPDGGADAGVQPGSPASGGCTQAGGATIWALLAAAVLGRRRRA